MARGRFLNTSIAEDIALNSLSIEAHWLYMMTIPHLDRDGLIKADTYVFFGKVCPRRPKLIPRIDALIAEWAAVGLAIVYPTHDGQVAFFRGFTKNQQGMTYSREGASALEPPPGYIRTSTGLEPNKGDSGESGSNTPCKPTPDQLLTNSRPAPDEVPANININLNSEVKSQVEVQVEAEGPAPPAAAAVENDIARLWAKWDANMPGAKTGVIVDSVNALLDDYSIAEIEQAITIACKRNKRSLSYVEGILAKGAFTEHPPPNGSDYRLSANGRMSPADKTQANADELRAIFKAQGKENLLHG